MTKKQALKLKPGDKVIMNSDMNPRFTKGKIYTIAKEDNYFSNPSSIQVVEDDFGNRNGWSEEYFELAYPTIFNKKLEDIINA